MSHGHEPVGPKVYGLVAEFESAEAIMEAAEKVRVAGYRNTDAYTPFPVHGLSDAIGFHDTRLPWMIFIGGLSGCFLGYTLEWYTSVIDYPLNVGGKPLNSLPAFFPVMYESTILLSALTAVFGMLALNRLPKPYHSIFNSPGFERATQDRFFLAVEASDKLYDPEATRALLESTSPLSLSEVME